MAYPIYTPRVNNNDDEVRLTELLVRAGDRVAVGQTLAQVETDKAVVGIDCDRAGYVLRVLPLVDTLIAVGSVLLWVGDSPDEPVPCDQGAVTPTPAIQPASEPTAKARQLLAQHNLNAADIPTRGPRLTVEDVEAYLSGQAAKSLEALRPATAALPLAPGTLAPLSMEERGMLRYVLWHRDEAVPAYLEIEFDQARWEEYARAFATEHRSLGNPLLPLMAHRFAMIARQHPRLNSTIIDNRRYVYDHVQLGVTIQAQDTLYLVVVKEAGNKEQHEFIEALTRLHRKAITRRLAPEELQGATVAFSSMARWQVSRHLPILPPHVSMIVAHTTSRDNRATLGATYDHRVLSGGDTVAILNQLAQPPE